MKSPEKSAFETILIVAVVLAIVLLPMAVKAESEHKHSPPPFSEFDQDGDGFVSEEEFNSTRAARMAAMAEAGRPMRGAATAPAFSDLDTDGDGRLSEAELIAGQKAHRKAMREQHKGHDGDGMHASGQSPPSRPTRIIYCRSEPCSRKEGNRYRFPSGTRALGSIAIP